VGISIREADLDCELPLLAATVNTAFGSRVSAERFRWLYLDNPDGRAVAWFAVDDRTGEIAGCTAVSPRRVRVAGQEVVAWNCGDFSIAARYRTMGAALKLRRAARDAVDAGLSPFLYAHPNARMLQVHLRVGHAPLATMRRFAKPLRLHTSHALVDRIASPLLRLFGTELLVRLRDEIEAIDGGPLPPDISQVYDDVKDRLGTAVVRDHTYLNWRFRANPEQTTCTLIARAGGRATAYLTFAMHERVATIKDWLAVDTASRDQVLTAFLREARRREAVSATAIVLETHPDIPALRRLGFLVRPETSMAVTYTTEQHPLRRDVYDPSQWYMTFGDRDV
jgi:hypothetical protein